MGCCETDLIFFHRSISAVSRELKSLVSRSRPGGRAEQGLCHGYDWNLDKGVLQHTELEDEDDADGPDDCCDNNDGHAVENPGSHVVDFDRLFSFIETNFCCRMGQKVNHL
jgi:hypothetical protein